MFAGVTKFEKLCPYGGTVIRRDIHKNSVPKVAPRKECPQCLRPFTLRFVLEIHPDGKENYNMIFPWHNERERPR